MKRRPTFLTMAAVVALGLIWAACTDAPTESLTELAAPQFKKGGKKPDAGGEFPTIVTFRDARDASGHFTDNIRSDDELRSDGLYHGPDYADDVCGVLAGLGNFDDARMDPDMRLPNGTKKLRDLEAECGATRVLIIDRDDPADNLPPIEDPLIIFGVFSNIDQVLLVMGTDEPHWGVFNAPDPCGQLFFDPDIPERGGSNSLLVSFDDNGTRADPADDVWTVKTRPYPNDKGFCSEDGRLFHLPFEMTIRRQQ